MHPTIPMLLTPAVTQTLDSEVDVGDHPGTPASESSGKFSDICGNKSDTGK